MMRALPLPSSAALIWTWIFMTKSASRRRAGKAISRKIFWSTTRNSEEFSGRTFGKRSKRVKMSFGTDAGVCPYDRSVKQFAFMVKYGMTPMQAIQAATHNAADLLGHSDVIGSIKPGKYADVIAVSGDPLQDISVLEHVQFVMKEGKIYKQ